MGVLVYCQTAHYTKKHEGCVIRDSCVNITLHVISLYNYTCNKHDNRQ